MGEPEEELESWDWCVWLRAEPKRRAIKPHRTRLAALIEASKRLGVGIDEVDAEAVRDA